MCGDQRAADEEWLRLAIEKTAIAGM